MLFFFGSKARSESVGKVDIACPQCGRRPCVLAVNTNKATVYFVPVANLKRTYQVTCGNCAHQWEIDADQGERLRGKSGPEKPEPEVQSVPDAAMGLLKSLRKTLDSGLKAPPPADPSTLTEAEASELLQEAVADGDLKRVKALVKAGAKVNRRDSAGWTPLMRAAEHGRLEMVRFLIEQGADVNNVSNNGFTALMRAFVNHHTETADLLRQSGAVR